MNAWMDNLFALPPALQKALCEEIRQSLLRGEGFDSLLRIPGDYEATGEYFTNPQGVEGILREFAQGVSPPLTPKKYTK